MQSSGFYCPKHNVRFVGSAAKEGKLPCGCLAQLYTYRKTWSGGKDGKPWLYFHIQVAVYGSQHQYIVGQDEGILFTVFVGRGRDDQAIETLIRDRDWPEWKEEMVLAAFRQSAGTGLMAHQWVDHQGGADGEEATG